RRRKTRFGDLFLDAEEVGRRLRRGEIETDAQQIAAERDPKRGYRRGSAAGTNCPPLASSPPFCANTTARGKRRTISPRMSNTSQSAIGTLTPSAPRHADNAG